MAVSRNITLDDGVGGGGGGATSTRTTSTTPTTRTVSTTVRTGKPLTGIQTSKLESIRLSGAQQINTALNEAPPQPYRTPTPVPDPEPKRPFEELPGDPRLIPGTKGLDQNPERYREGVDKWTVQAEPQIVPLELVKGSRPELKPVLWADGIIVKIGDEYLCSKRTFADIHNSANPHYDIAENGRVLNRPMGRSVPIIQVDITRLKELGDSRDRVNRYAGVKSVDYVNESEPVPGTNIPQGLLNQINWTLVEELERYPDRFEVYDIMATMQGNYTIQALVTSTAQEENKLDKSKLADFLTGLDDRLKRIRNDFNGIKRVFYNGAPPLDAVSTIKYVKVAKTINPEDEESKNPVVIKITETVGIEDNRLDKTITDLSNSIKGIKGELKSATTPPGQKTGAGDQKQALIAKWQSYKWTEQEAEYLKTTAEDEVAKPPSKTTNKVTTQGKTQLEWLGYELNDKIVGISRVRWTPAMIVKAAIIVPLPEAWGSSVVTGGAVTYNSGRLNPIIKSKTEEELIRLYGTPPGYNPARRTYGSSSANTYDNRNELWWIEQNAKRQAEIVQLAYDIHKIELETGKKIPNIQPPGVTIGGTPANTRGNLFSARL